MKETISIIIQEVRDQMETALFSSGTEAYAVSHMHSILDDLELRLNKEFE